MSHRAPWKRAVGRMFGATRRAGPRRVILTYHSVASGPLSMPAATFAEQMSWLAGQTRLLPLDALLRGTDAEPAVAVTFDDGYESVAMAADILAKTGHAGTVFVNTAFIGDGTRRASDSADGHYPGERFLDWEGVRALRRGGWIVGSHGVHHFALPGLSARALEDELSISKDAVEQRLGEPCRFVAYPWGLHSAAVRTAVAACGYEAGIAAVHGAVTPRTDRFAVPRVTVQNDYSLDDLAAILRGGWDYLRYVQSTRNFLHARFGAR